MLVYNCIVVDVGGCISQVTLSGFHCYVLLNSDVIMIVHEHKETCTGRLLAIEFNWCKLMKYYCFW